MTRLIQARMRVAGPRRLNLARQQRQRGSNRRHLDRRPTLAIMVKEPAMGRVKTRLGRDIGGVAATWFYRHAARAVIQRISQDRRWRTVLAVAPVTALASRAWPLDLLRMAQGQGGLGHRMQTVALSVSPGPLVIVGTDIPAITPASVEGVLRLARQTGAAFGPAPDGGYWAVALRRTPRILVPFTAVRWSGPFALADTIARLPSGVTARRGAVLFDVDDRPSYQACADWFGRVVLPHHSA